MATTEKLRHFKKVEMEVDTETILKEIESNPETWHANVRRQHMVHCQQHTLSIPLRGPSRQMGEEETPTRDIQKSSLTTLSRQFPETLALCERMANKLEGTLGRAMLVALKPQHSVFPHIDTGTYYAKRDRLHLVVFSPTGSLMKAGSEEVVMYEDELWIFNNKVVHSADNASEMPRIHLIFDIEPRSGWGWFNQETDEK